MVDDEEIIRRGFETRIDWASQGFEFLPPCENGREAIAAIDEALPDVVMTDIHMPHADGISVAAHVMERHPGIVVVILSGYDEFGYAQAAIRNKVFDYVLKPVSSRDLLALLAKIKGKLDADRRASDDETALKERAVLSADLLRERALAEFLGGGAAPAPAEGAFVLGFEPGTMACAALVVERDDSPGGAPGLAAPSIRDRLAAALRQAHRSAAFFPDEDSGTALVFEPGSGRCAAAAAAIASLLTSGGGGALRVGVGRAYELWIDAPRAYAEARAALSYRLIREPTKPFFYLQAAEDREALERLRAGSERLCLGVRTGASRRVDALARDYLEALAAADLSPQRVRHEVLALFSRAHDELAGIGVTSTALGAKLASDYYRFAEGLDRPSAISSALTRLAEIAAESLETSSQHEPEWKILDFKQQIARRFAEPQLSIGAVAGRLAISESYLSKLLRRRLGTSFVDYVSDYRVERAKELLATSDMMGYEVAESVGYPDSRYFASLFKKRTGMTPSEYRRTLGDASAAGPGGGGE